MVCSLSVVLGCHGGIVRHFQLRPLLKHRDLFVQICAVAIAWAMLEVPVV